jgi:cell division septation protein DedD
MRARRALFALVLALAPAPTLAQSTDLDRVEELTRLGRAEEARTILAAWWDGPRADAPARDLQRGLWLRGRLTVDPAQAELDFQRIVVLYPSGSYAPQALFRLAQAAHARGDADAAGNHVAALVRDHPTAPSRNQAEAWLRAAGPAPPRVEARTPAGAPPAAAPSTTAPATAPATTTAGTITPAPAAAPPAPAAAVLDWYVQFGAFSDEDRAFDLQRELVAAGLAARLVRVQGSGFLHVRLGRFGAREDANRQLEDVTRRGFTAAIVRDDRAEEVVRR